MSDRVQEAFDGEAIIAFQLPTSFTYRFSTCLVARLRLACVCLEILSLYSLLEPMVSARSS